MESPLKNKVLETCEVDLSRLDRNIWPIVTLNKRGWAPLDFGARDVVFARSKRGRLVHAYWIGMVEDAHDFDQFRTIARPVCGARIKRPLTIDAAISVEFTGVQPGLPPAKNLPDREARASRARQIAVCPECAASAAGHRAGQWDLAWEVIDEALADPERYVVSRSYRSYESVEQWLAEQVAKRPPKPPKVAPPVIIPESVIRTDLVRSTERIKDHELRMQREFVGPLRVNIPSHITWPTLNDMATVQDIATTCYAKGPVRSTGRPVIVNDEWLPFAVWLDDGHRAVLDNPSALKPNSVRACSRTTVIGDGKPVLSDFSKEAGYCENCAATVTMWELAIGAVGGAWEYACTIFHAWENCDEIFEWRAKEAVYGMPFRLFLNRAGRWRFVDIERMPIPHDALAWTTIPCDRPRDLAYGLITVIEDRRDHGPRGGETDVLVDLSGIPEVLTLDEFFKLEYATARSWKARMAHQHGFLLTADAHERQLDRAAAAQRAMQLASGSMQ